MKLLARFNLIFVIVFGVGLAVAAWLANSLLQRDARDRVLETARLMMETTLATRAYTTDQIKPLLVGVQKKNSQFLPQTVPAFSAIQVFDYLHKRNPDYAYKEAMLNPTNPADRATDWEADIIERFRNDPSLKDFHGERNTPTGPSVFLSRPLRVSSPACLECHSTPDRAPVSMIRQYGANNGFGWHASEIVGAQVISVPESLPIAIANTALKTLLIYLVGVGIVTLIILDAVLVVTVIRPVSKLSRMAEEISQGKVDIEELPVKGRDEVSVLAAAFNRMQRSLSRAMKLLEAEDEPSDQP